MTDRELMQMALDVIKDHTDMNNPQQQAFRNNAIRLLRNRLAQPERKWVGLTDEEITDLWAGVSSDDDEISIWKLGHAIEAKLKEKNT
jgi:hypothetical protein